MFSLILLSTLNFADAKKSKGDSTETESTSEKKKKTATAANVPDDNVSKAFAKNLLETTGTDFSPNALGLTYTKLTFSADNTFTAEGLVAIMDEEMDCLEKGTWNLDPAKSETVANMDWIITETDCPSRQAPIQLRLEVILTGTAAGINGNFR